MNLYHAGLSTALTPQEPRSLYRRGASVSIGRLFHSVADREQAIAQLDLDWQQLYQDLGLQMGEFVMDASEPTGIRLATQAEFDAINPDPVQLQWYRTYARPLAQDWSNFRVAQLGQDRTGPGVSYRAWAERWRTDWSEYEDWKTKLDSLRALAKARKFKLRTPTPAELPKTVWQDIADDARKGAQEVWETVKMILWVGVAIGAGYLLWKVLVMA